MKASQREENRSLGLWLRAALLPLLILALILLMRKLGFGGDLGELRGWIEAHDRLGGLVFVLVYTVAGASGLFCLPLTLAAGVLFGSVKGLILVSLGATSGAALAFGLARTLAREAVRRWLGGRDVFERLEHWTGERGAVVVLLTRLFPVFPYSLLNYSFGLTRVGVWTFLFWTWLGMLPGHIFYVTGMDALTRGLAEGELPWPLLGIALAALALLAALIPWARRQLRRDREDD